MSYFKDLTNIQTETSQKSKRKIRDNIRRTSLGQSFWELRKKQLDRVIEEEGMRFDINQLLIKGNPAMVKVVLIHFSTFVSFRKRLFIPAEVALTAFTVEGGIIDNYWSFIDPYILPKGLYFTAKNSSKVLGIPNPPFSNRYQNYVGIIEKIEYFIKKHADPKTEKTLVFCLRKDFEKNKGCLDWLYDQLNSKCTLNLYPFGELVKQLSVLGIMTRSAREKLNTDHVMAKIVHERNLLEQSHSDEAEANGSGVNYDYFTILRSDAWETQSSDANCSYYVRSRIPQTKDGGFFSEKFAEDFFESMESAYDSELCCLFHNHPEADGIENCPLNITNRYAYYALSILLANYNIKPRAGFHFFERLKPETELERRYQLLENWGINEENTLDFEWDDTQPPPFFSLRIAETVIPSNNLRPLC